MSDAVHDPRQRWQRVEELYAQVLERHANDRASLLDAACKEDPALRAEVESLLACTPAAAAFIETSAIEVAADDLGRGFDEVLVGTQLGAYVVGDWLGSGGMGDVYRARDTHLQRDVALKILPGVVDGGPDAPADARIARFKREAQVLASLNHPNVAAIYGFVEGRTAAGGRATCRCTRWRWNWWRGQRWPSASHAVRSRWTRHWPSRGRSPKASRLPMDTA